MIYPLVLITDIPHKKTWNYIKENQIDTYIPAKKQAPKGSKNVKPFSQHKLKYDPQVDAYICPNNKKTTLPKDIRI